ncbi:MAG: hypothetical protein RLO18_10305 [Gimesia chilikensis]
MTVRKKKVFYVACLLLLCGICQACGSSDGPVMAPVKGDVTIDGTPLPQGDIIFEPADGKGSASAGVIQQGHFEFSSSVGRKKVLIFASRKTGKKGDFGEDVMESYIPKKYNTDSELIGEVSPDADNKFVFHLEQTP